MGMEQIGAAKLRLDDRGRVAIPKNSRALLCQKSGFVLTAHPHGCLVIYTNARFENIQQQFQSRSNMSYFDSHLEELILGSAEPLLPDSAERFLIGGHLRDYAAIQRDIRMFHLPDCVRLWSEERWGQRHALMTARLQDEGFSSWQDLRL